MIWGLSSGCSAERNLSRAFARSWEPPALLLLTPDGVIRENLKTSEVDKLKGLSPQARDSLLLSGSTYLKDVSDSMFLDTYVNAFAEKLRSQGYTVYWESQLDTFLTLPGPSWILDMAQVMLEEYSIPKTEQQMFDDTITYYKRIDLNAVSMHSWFELSPVNTDNARLEVLYASHFLQDRLQGSFVRHPLKGTVSYKYSLREMQLNDIYHLAGILGIKYAGWITDHFMHNYVKMSLPESYRPRVWFHFDPEKASLVRSWGERFLVLDQ
ncbi:MAG TPA: hypothetical protein P5248_04900 [Bacteroidales bacterium]|nr:hypothetical protein [Bacteroidales bacterium]